MVETSSAHEITVKFDTNPEVSVEFSLVPTGMAFSQSELENALADQINKIAAAGGYGAMSGCASELARLRRHR